ncbi:lipase 3-like isoform X2 [Periplaneta americana]|uniref:lipase 3-like isoform X2 n=1 Tax=Periplaneta americana TaxID=6978 RepID=UPI0037E7DF4C
MTSLAPVAFMKHVASPLVQFSANFPGAQLGMEAIELLGVGELMPSNAFMQILADVACSEGSVLQPMCENILFLLVGYDPSQLNELKEASGCGISTLVTWQNKEVCFHHPII